MTDLTVYAAAVIFVAFIAACIGIAIGQLVRRREDADEIARLEQRIADLLDDVDGDAEWDLGAQAELDEMILAAQRSSQ